MSRLGKDVNKLLQGIKDGRDEDKQLLFETTYNHLKIVARRYVHNQNDVEDVLQTVYLRVFSYIGSWNSSKDGYNWICRIVQNEAYRLNEKNPSHLPLEEYAKSPVSKDITDEISARDEIERYLSVYSELDKELVLLKYGHNYSYGEIAKQLKLKKSTVHRRVSMITKEILEKRGRKLDENEKQ